MVWSGFEVLIVSRVVLPNVDGRIVLTSGVIGLLVWAGVGVVLVGGIALTTVDGGPILTWDVVICVAWATVLILVVSRNGVVLLVMTSFARKLFGCIKLTSLVLPEEEVWVNDFRPNIN